MFSTAPSTAGIEVERATSPGTNTGIEPAGRVEQRRAGGVGREVGVEHVRRRRLRVAAGALAAEPLVAALGLVAAAQLPEVGDAAGELPVVAAAPDRWRRSTARCRCSAQLIGERTASRAMLSCSVPPSPSNWKLALASTAPRPAGCLRARRDSSCSSTSSACCA